ncbi:hypothetical protein, partial [uncultured Anaerococcus sp.]|uniref:hypothetical protein n=1 Tax=uncultured Anaerococcus sp. TaxID=293428 RepID=UPI00288C001C
MKKINKIVALTLLASLSANAVGLVNPASSSISYASTKLDLGMSTDSPTSQSITINLKQDQETRDRVLAAMKKIRSEMWDKNVPFRMENSNPDCRYIRDFWGSKEDFVNSIYMLPGLELLAVQRLFDISLTGFDFNRPDGSNFNDLVTPNGSRSSRDGLAQSVGTMSVDEAFDIWSYQKLSNLDGKSMYDKLLESNGVITEENFVLHCILSPLYSAVGFAYTDTPGKNYAVLEFAPGESGNDEVRNFVGEYTMDYGKPAKKELDPETKASLEKAIYENRIQ